METINKSYRRLTQEIFSLQPLSQEIKEELNKTDNLFSEGECVENGENSQDGLAFNLALVGNTQKSPE